MIDAEIIQKRLEKLHQYISLLQKLSEQPLSRFLSDPFVQGNVERYLQLSIQVSLDIGNHILAEIETRAPEEYRDIFILLGENKVVPVDLAKKMAPLAGLRNILVHDYLEIDLKRIYKFLKNDLSDFSEFAKYISKYVFGKEKDGVPGQTRE